MQKTRSWSFVAGLALAAMACGGTPRPEARLASSEGAIRGAEEAGANQVPAATLYVKLAQEERQHAIDLIKSGENHRASFVLARAEADAELAVALSHAAFAQVVATKSQEAVDTINEKAAQ